MKPSAQSAMLGTLLTEAALLLGTLVTGSLTARLLLPEGRGTLAAILYWPQLLAGIGLLSVHEATTYRVGNRPDTASSTRASSLCILMALAGVTMAVGSALIPLFLAGAERSGLATLSQAYLLTFIPFHFVASGLYASDQGELRFLRYNALRLINCLIYLGGVVALWSMGRVTPATVMAANCAGTVVVASLRFIVQGRALLARPSWVEMGYLLRLAGRFHPATVLLFLAMQMDRLVVMALWDNEALGQYVVAFSMASAGLSVVGAASHRVLFPQLARVVDVGAQTKLLGRGVRQATLLLVALAIPLGLFMRPLMLEIFGPSFAGVVETARMLVLAYACVALRTIVIQGLRGIGDGRPGTIAAAVCIAAFLATARPLGASLGLTGVAIALAIGNIAACGYLGAHLYRRYQLGVRELWGLNGATVAELWSARPRRAMRPRDGHVEAHVAP
jgi:enterobacterial common antigen flippase